MQGRHTDRFILIVHPPVTLADLELDLVCAASHSLDVVGEEVFTIGEPCGLHPLRLPIGEGTGEVDRGLRSGLAICHGVGGIGRSHVVGSSGERDVGRY